ncbi:MAG: cold-shock protein [Halioglobus sp.]|nr:cold-shock protein [Halioglobus sp.]
MNQPRKLVISLAIALVAATLTSVILTGSAFNLVLLLAFAITACSCALLGGATNALPQVPAQEAEGDRRPQPAPLEGDREHGKVKWFNVSKGFGFIIRENGEEIFVHFRSIRGSGRRSLRDGQTVSFVVADSDKGPQAEDVVAGE